MDADLKKILKAVVLEMRHELEGYYDNAGKWHPGDLETRLAEIGVRKDRASVPVDELGRLIDEDVRARKIVDAFITVREQAGVDRSEAVAEYIRESAYTWANRLVALRCMEARELLDDEVIVGREAYGGRSLVHHRLAQSSPELCTGEDDGRFAMLAQVFAERAQTLPMLFDPDSPSIALRPSPAALKNSLAWLSGTQKVRSQEPATDAVFAAPDALGWAYQYWNTEEKDRVFETVRTKKGAKIEGADIIPATQLYTEDYMVKFLVQNSLGASWMGMHPESKLFEGWEYYVRDADRAPAKKKTLQQITLLDPACGSGHFLIEAFDMFYTMYEEEGSLKVPEAICRSILENNLFGVDIDERAIQIAEASLWMRAEEKAFGFSGANTNLVAATSSHLKGESWERYLAKLQNEPSTVRVLRKFAVEMEHIDELGSLARPAEALETIINEEHEIWEKQEGERRQADKSLFKEIRDDLLASQLPFQDISDKEFFERTMRHALFAIDGFTAEARDSGEFNDQLMGAEAKTGFRLLELLSRKYEVVVANPPYMGSKNMGPVLKDYVSKNFTPGKRDIYAAFILRNISLCSLGARVAMVTRDSWLFQNEYASLRYEEPEAEQLAKGILADTQIELMAHLGPNAFNEISGEVVSVALFVVSAVKASNTAKTVGIRVTGDSDPSIKERELRLASADCSRRSVNTILQLMFLRIPTSPILYWLRGGLLDVFVNPKSRIGDLANVCAGLSTGANPRFVRGNWECATGRRWVAYEKGGGLCKWWGLRIWSVDWENDGHRIKRFDGSAVRAESLYFTSGLTYTGMAQGSLGARLLAGDGIFAVNSSSGVFPRENICKKRLCAVLSSHFASYLLRCVIPKPQISEDYLSRLPLPVQLPLRTVEVVDLCLELKKHLMQHTLLERDFDPTLITRQSKEQIALKQLKDSAVLHLAEGLLNLRVVEAGGLDEESVKEICNETGIPSGWLPILSGWEDLPSSSCRSSHAAQDLREFAAGLKLISSAEGDNAARLISELFCISDGGPEDEDIDETNHVEDDEAARKAIPPETLLEELAQKSGLNPISVFRIVEDGIANKEWRCLSQSRRIYADQVSVHVLRLLGHRWPKERLADDTICDREDDDGIIPMTSIEKESTLQERVSVCFQEASIDTSDFSELLGKSIDDWLTSEFFQHHIKQFKKRPLAWHLQTTKFTSRSMPVFACLVYFHRVDIDSIHKLRTQYLGPLKLRFETEFRGIASTLATNRTDSQAKRSIELEDSITELQVFDAKLIAVTKSGFGPANLLSVLRQYALNDAMLSMKACWLKRLSELLNHSSNEDAEVQTQKTSLLNEWRSQAIKIGLHPELDRWIAEALLNLRYFCSQIGPEAPNAKQTTEDPTGADFGSLIQAEISSMQTGSMKLACGAWWGKFDAAVLAPIRERIKILKAEQKELNAAIKEDRQHVLVAEQVLEESSEYRSSEIESAVTDMPLLRNHVFEPTIELTKAAMKARLKEVKAKIKKLTEEMDSKAGKAQAIRDGIQAWRLPDPIPASLDFSPSSPNLPPFFDQVSSLDERRSPPRTIADFIAQESLYAPDINDGVRVNIAPLQKAGVLAADVLAAKDVDKAIADRAEWRADERRWVREGKLPLPGWWKSQENVDKIDLRSISE